MSVVQYAKEAALFVDAYNRRHEQRRFFLQIVPEGINVIFQDLVLRSQLHKLTKWRDITMAKYNPLLPFIRDCDPTYTAGQDNYHGK